MSTKKDNAWIWIIVTILLIIVIVITVVAFFVRSGNKNISLSKEDLSKPEETTKTTPVSSNTANTETENKTTKTYRIGETIDYQGKKLTVKKVDKNWKSSKSYDKPPAGTNYVAINVTVENETKETYWVNEVSNFDLIDSNGKLYTNTSLGGEGLDNLQQVKLYPGKSFNGNLLFEVDSNAVDKMILVYYPDYYSEDEKGEKIEVEL